MLWNTDHVTKHATLIPGQVSKPMTWNFTVGSTLTHSHQHTTRHWAGGKKSCQLAVSREILSMFRTLQVTENWQFCIQLS